jgi:hypothetical protein
MNRMRDDYLIGLLARGAFLYAGAAGVLAIAVVVQVIHSLATGQPFTVAIPVAAGYPGAERLTITGVTLSVSQPTIAQILLLGLGHILLALSGAAVALVVGLLAHRAHTADAFAQAAVRMLVAASIVVAVGFSAADILLQAGQSLVADQITESSRYGDLHLSTGGYAPNLIPLVAALILVAIAALVPRRGNAALKRETEGLV